MSLNAGQISSLSLISDLALHMKIFK